MKGGTGKGCRISDFLHFLVKAHNRELKTEELTLAAGWGQATVLQKAQRPEQDAAGHIVTESGSREKTKNGAEIQRLNGVLSP